MLASQFIGLGDAGILNIINRNVFVKACVCISLFVSILIYNITDVLTDYVHYKNSVSSKANSMQILPINLNEISLAKLKSLKKEFESKSEQLRPTAPRIDI